jgi:hypothetical protein
MIDTDKYEGHTHTKEWGDIVYADGYLPIFLNDGVYATDLDRELMADAPLLLAEYKLLREQLSLANERLANAHQCCLTIMDTLTEYIGDEEE